MRVAAQRLRNQRVSQTKHSKPESVVEWFGAMQAQDYLGALWAVGLRTRGATEASVQAALDSGRVLRTHVFRGTWQYVLPADLRWMLELVAERIIAASASRFRSLSLDRKLLDQACALFEDALSGGKHLTRNELSQALARDKIPSHDGRLMHILGYAELKGLLCSGARRGKHPTFALVSERVPRVARLSRDEALAELARRYVQSRAPVTERDFAWWSGLPLRDVRAALELAAPTIRQKQNDEVTLWYGDTPRVTDPGGALLLPAFDELLVAYADRSAFVDSAHVKAINAGGGMLRPTLMLDGRLAGTWQRSLGKTVEVEVKCLRPLTRGERAEVESAVERYGDFLALPARLKLTTR